MSGAALVVEHLAVEVGGIEVVSDVSFDLPPGQCLGIAGESGSGKSMTCRALTGTIARVRGRITRGSVRFGNDDLVSASRRDWRRLRGREIALVPQSSLTSLDPLMRIGSQLTETIRHIDGRRGVHTRALALLEEVQLPDPAGVLPLYPHQLSGGMRQRVMIALALAGRPALLVADEATTALDVTVQRGILDLLARLRHETGLSVVLVTHDLAVVEETSDRIAVVYAGQTVETGSTREVLASPEHPYTQALLAARPGAAPSGKRLLGITGAPPTPGNVPPGCRFAPRCAYVEPRCTRARPILERTSVGEAACVRLTTPSE